MRYYRLAGSEGGPLPDGYPLSLGTVIRVASVRSPKPGAVFNEKTKCWTSPAWEECGDPRLDPPLTPEQLALELEPLVIPDPAPTPEERFHAFASANPQIERLLVRYARQLLAQGHRRLSMRMLWERVRFEFAAQVKGDSRAALNNDLAPFYSRHLMATYADLAGVFETRERRVA